MSDTIFFDPDTGITLDIPEDKIIRAGQSSDPINPDHYKTETLEAIEVMRAFCSKEEFTGHLRCTAIKYLLRLHKKDSPLVNAQKCKWYVEALEKELR